MATAAPVDTEEVRLLQELAQIEERELATIKRNPLAFYTPSGAVEVFIRSIAARHPEQIIHYLCGANRIGKGAFEANLIGNISLGPQSDWWEFPVFRAFPPHGRGRIIGPHEGLDESVLRELPKWLPPGKYRSWKDGRNYLSKWEVYDREAGRRWEWDVMTNDQPLEQFESASLNAVVEDEPLDEERHSATVARLEPGAIMCIGATPLRNANYMFEHCDLATDFQYEPEGHYFLHEPEGNWNVCFAHQESNCREHGIRGIYPHEWLAKKASEYLEDERKARVEGKPMLAGLVLHYKPQVHAVEPFPIPDHWPRLWHIDCHYGNVPAMAVGIAVSPDEDLHIYDEAVLHGRVPDMAAELRWQHWNHGRDWINLCLIDPLAETVDPVTQTSQKSHWDAGLLVTTLSTGAEKANRENGIKLLNDRFAGVHGRPTLYVHAQNTPYTVWEMRRWRYDERTGKPLAKNDHMMQGLYRLILQDPKFEHLRQQKFNSMMGNGTRPSSPYVCQ